VLNGCKYTAQNSLNRNLWPASHRLIQIRS